MHFISVVVNKNICIIYLPLFLTVLSMACKEFFLWENETIKFENSSVTIADSIPGSSNNPVMISSQHLFHSYSPGSTSIQYISQQSQNNVTPYLIILEQPKSQMRFRYPTEKGSHGYLTGQNSKSFPTVKLENYRERQPVFIRASLYTDDEAPIAHVHSLCGLNCHDDVCTFGPLTSSMTAKFQNLKIAFCPKKNAEPTLFERYQRNSVEPQEVIERRVQENLKKIKDSNYSSVKILFEAYQELETNNIKILASIFSQPIYHQTDIACSTLKISRLSKLSSCKKGNEEVFLLCDKVDKNNIAIRFFEHDENGDIIWQKDAVFSKADVHHQFAIVFRTPPYDGVIIGDKPKKVKVQLYRRSDQQVSESHEFEYVKDDNDAEELTRKKMKTEFPYSCGFQTESVSDPSELPSINYSAQNYPIFTQQSSMNSPNLQNVEDSDSFFDTLCYTTASNISPSTSKCHYLKSESLDPVLGSASSFKITNRSFRSKKPASDVIPQCAIFEAHSFHSQTLTNVLEQTNDIASNIIEDSEEITDDDIRNPGIKCRVPNNGGNLPYDLKISNQIAKYFNYNGQSAQRSKRDSGFKKILIFILLVLLIYTYLKQYIFI